MCLQTFCLVAACMSIVPGLRLEPMKVEVWRPNHWTAMGVRGASHSSA